MTTPITATAAPIPATLGAYCDNGLGAYGFLAGGGFGRKSTDTDSPTVTPWNSLNTASFADTLPVPSTESEIVAGKWPTDTCWVELILQPLHIGPQSRLG